MFTVGIELVAAVLAALLGLIQPLLKLGIETTFKNNPGAVDISNRRLAKPC